MHKVAANRKTPIYDPYAPGMAPPGPNVLAASKQLAGEAGDPEALAALQHSFLRKIYRDIVWSDSYVLPILCKGNQYKSAYFVPGHLWNEQAEAGPRRADVMVIGKVPGKLEHRECRNLVGPSGQLLREVLLEQGAKPQDLQKWYVTNLVRFEPPEDASQLKVGWIKDCFPLLQEELRLVRPKYILLLGSDASKKILGEKKTVTYMNGRVEELVYDCRVREEDEPRMHTAKVMTVIHPAQVVRTPETRSQLDQGIARWMSLVRGEDVDAPEDDIDHRVLRSMKDLRKTLDDADRETPDGVIAVDAEWHGQHPQDKGSYLRTIQFAWAHKKAACVVLRKAGGGKGFAEGEKAAINALRKFFQGKRVVGHFLNADLEWLVHYGLDLRPNYAVPVEDTVDENGEPVFAWERTRTEGGADTAIMQHSLDETAMFGLEHLSLKWTSCPRYDIPLHDWKIAYCKEHKIGAKALEGYGACPDEILEPYSLYDADTTLRIYRKLEAQLDEDAFGNCVRESYWRNMAAQPAVLEINTIGITLELPRVQRLTENFLTARAEHEQKLRDWARWPEFNLRSVQQMRELLFGEKHNGKVTKDGSIVKLRPPGARSLRVVPYMTTTKPPKLWSEVLEKGDEKDFTPSTGKASLAILAQENPKQFEQIGLVRDHRFLDQVLKTLLRPPKKTVQEEAESEAGTDPADVSGPPGVRTEWDIYSANAPWVSGTMDGVEFDGGLVGCMSDDGRLRTHISTLKETRRWSSSRPNLQAVSKKRDKDYIRMLGDRYKFKLRSCLRATRPTDRGRWCDEQCVLVESDFSGAELALMAWMSGDPVMIEHARRNSLPESDPEYFDMHSNIACIAFNLKCAPTKQGLKSIGMYHLRDISKTVIFGSAYGQMPKALALKLREEKEKDAPIATEADAKRVQDTIFGLYRELAALFAECRRRASDERWICGPFGGFRRVPPVDDRARIGEFERQFMNFPIQNGIADAVNQAVTNLIRYRAMAKDPDMFRIVLQIHDAIILEVPLSRLKRVLDRALPWSMQEQNPIYPCTLDGMPTGAGPYRLGRSTDVYEYWGEDIPEKTQKKWKIDKLLAH